MSRPWSAAALLLLASACLFDDEPGALELDAPRRIDISAGAGPLVVADLDADGRPDLVWTNASAGTAAIEWGRPEGTHEPFETWSIGQRPGTPVVADLDADGRLDLAAPLADGGAVAVLFGRGGRSFAAPLRVPCGARPRDLAATDLDGDGRLDLVAADDDAVHVLRGTKEGFAPARATPVGADLRALAVGDFTGDGAPDVVAGLADAGEVHLLEWTGPEGLSPRDVLHAGGVASALVAADLDGDGALDLGVADGLLDEVVALFGDGAGGVRDARRWTVPPAPDRLAVRRSASGPELVAGNRELLAQIDPRSDLPARLTLPPVAPVALAAGPAAPTDEEPLIVSGIYGLHVLVPTSGPTFAPAWRDPVPEPLHALDAVDVDLDGYIDLVATAPDGERMLVFPGEGDLRFGDPRVHALGPFLKLRLADMDADGRVDVVRLRSEPELSLTLDLLTQQPDGSFALLENQPSEPLRDFIVADLDADDVPEVLATSSLGVRVRRFSDPDAAPLAAPEPLFTDGSVRDYAVNDLDGDGDLDLVTFEYGYPDDLLVTHARAGGTYLRVSELPLAPEWAGADPSFADLDGDGLPEALLCGNSLALAPGVAPLAFGPPRELAAIKCARVAAADLDGDSIADLVVTRTTSASADVPAGFEIEGVEVLRGLGPQADGLAFARGHSTAPAGNFDSLVVADLDADAQPEVWIGGDLGASVLRAAEGPILTPQEPVAATGNARVELADLDGDGRLDLVARSLAHLGAAFQDARGEFGPTRYHDLGPLGVKRLLAASASDVDGDAIDEVLAVSQADDGSGLSLLTLDLSEGLALRRALPLLGQELLAFAVLDADEDGRADVLLSTDGTPDLHRIPRAAEFPSSGLGVWVDPGAASVAISVADIDRDGHLDLLNHGWSGLELHRGDGRGGFAFHRFWEFPSFALEAVGDLDGDGRTDLLYAIGFPPTLMRCPLTADLSLGACRSLGVTASLGATAILDFDADGWDDLLLLKSDAEGPHLLVARMDPEGRLVPRRAPLPVARGGELRRAVLDPARGPELVALDSGGLTRISALD